MDRRSFLKNSVALSLSLANVTLLKLANAQGMFPWPAIVSVSAPSSTDIDYLLPGAGLINATDTTALQYLIPGYGLVNT